MEKPLNSSQKKFLLDLARQSIEAFLKKGKHLQLEPEDQELRKFRGAFVTLKKNNELRGCIGFPLPIKPLYETVAESAVAAATQDFRFPRLTVEELPEISIEISALSLPRQIKDISEIKIGKHGIIVSKGLHKGLLLPQVPLEWKWNLETYLCHGCLKAGLGEDEWKKGAQIEIFEAEIFSDIQAK